MNIKQHRLFRQFGGRLTEAGDYLFDDISQGFAVLEIIGADPDGLRAARLQLGVTDAQVSAVRAKYENAAVPRPRPPIDAPNESDERFVFDLN